MRTTISQRVMSLWLVWVPTLIFLIGLLWDGLGGGVLAATLSFLVVGPLYLGRQWWLGRTGRIPPAAPPTPARQALFLRLVVIVNGVLGIGFLVGAIDGGWLPGRGWTAILVVVVVCSLGAAPYLLATAAEVEHGRASPRAWAVAAASDLLVAVGLLAFAGVNLWTDWLPGAWSVALAVLGSTWVVAALGAFARSRDRAS
ncbi:MAG TPA: hypothetical protein VLA87_11130 [Gaiellaceae bacterium]|nr:hypothetical protein [Gaiellaceae bacterium]